MSPSETFIEIILHVHWIPISTHFIDVRATIYFTIQGKYGEACDEKGRTNIFTPYHSATATISLFLRFPIEHKWNPYSMIFVDIIMTHSVAPIMAPKRCTLHFFMTIFMYFYICRGDFWCAGTHILLLHAIMASVDGNLDLWLKFSGTYMYCMKRTYSVPQGSNLAPVMTCYVWHD